MHFFSSFLLLLLVASNSYHAFTPSLPSARNKGAPALSPMVQTRRLQHEQQHCSFVRMRMSYSQGDIEENLTDDDAAVEIDNDETTATNDEEAGDGDVVVVRMEGVKGGEGGLNGDAKMMMSLESDESSDEAPSATTETTTAARDKNLLYLQSLGAITSRGEFATKAQQKSALSTIRAVEAENPTLEPALSPLIRGRWELVYSSTQLFRSSPFFMAGRAVCTTQSQADQYNWFCDMHRKALAASTIGPVRQVVSENRLVSEFEVRAGAVPFLSDLTPFAYSGGMPVSIDGAIVSSADLTPLSDGSGWELFMDTVEIKGSNIPGLRQVLDRGLKLQSRSLGNLLESSLSSYKNPRPTFRTTYLDETFRISRDQDDNAFVYVKTSLDDTPTDYSSVDSDLGIGRLLEGFNDAITKFYI